MDTDLRSTARRDSGSDHAFVFEPIDRAAELLVLDPEALRARCRRAARKEGRDIVAYLGGGVAAFKFGRSWRVRFPARASG